MYSWAGRGRHRRVSSRESIHDAAIHHLWHIERGSSTRLLPLSPDSPSLNAPSFYRIPTCLSRANLSFPYTQVPSHSPTTTIPHTLSCIPNHLCRISCIFTITPPPTPALPPHFSWLLQESLHSYRTPTSSFYARDVGNGMGEGVHWGEESIGDSRHTGHRVLAFGMIPPSVRPSSVGVNAAAVRGASVGSEADRRGVALAWRGMMGDRCCVLVDGSR